MTAQLQESLTKWFDDNLISSKKISDRIIEVPDFGKFLILGSKDIHTNNGLAKDKIFDLEFQIIVDDEENELADQVDYLLFEFGDRWYYSDSLTPDELKEFKYIGKSNLFFADKIYPFLGIHGPFELCNGSRDYNDWIKKAKFLGIDTLGLCEENTLAGTLAFQEACLKANIKPIIGMSVTVLTSTKGRMGIKLYVENEEGWQNLLWISKLINVDNDGGYIKEEQLFNREINTEGLICVLSPEVDLKKYWGNDKFDFYFSKVYFQIDFCEWSSGQKDEQWLTSLKNYFDNYILEEGNTLEPILITDAYYIDKEDYKIKKTLNNIGKVGFKNQSKDQYFKSPDEIYTQCAGLFAEDDERWSIFLDLAIENANSFKAIDYKIPVGVFRLPDFEMDELMLEVYDNSEGLFEELLNAGIEEKILGKVPNEKVYLDRVKEEVDVIKRGGFVDYFLILWDILEWCKTQGIWFGIGRGSAAGSLVSYLLGIVGIDPLKYGLLFSRFLNAGRIGKSLPDIDMDFQGERRDEVKRYMESKYGVDNVTAIGTYGTMKAKGAIKDLARERGANFSKTNIITNLIEDSNSTFTDIFKLAAKINNEKPDLKRFIQQNYKLFEQLPLCLNQPKSASIHASGVVIVPKQKDGHIYKQMPVRRDEGILISQWEGEWIDKAGFLKFDILGVKQLDKIAEMAKIIEARHGVKIKFEDIDLDNKEVFTLFKLGYTEDVFQFGTAGLKAYCKELKPDNVNDLIAAVSLYRPGPMDTGMHKQYIKVKNGLEKPVYDPGTERATKETYGIAIYQEQVMQICVDVAGFDLIQADDVRKAMGKKDPILLKPYKEKFVAGGIKKGFEEHNLLTLWEKLETFSRYGFNKSHAAAYSITGYYTQWLKVKFPLEFWTISLQYAEEKEIINRISEITKTSDIEVAGIDINYSTKTFFAVPETNTIYWAINSVKWVGPTAVEPILEDREKNGEYFSIEDFCERIKGTKVNKRCIVNLILAGAFDKMENILPHQRGLLLKKYATFTSQKLNEELLETDGWKDYQWILKQKELTGFGFIDYKNIVSGSSIFATQQKKFRENADIILSDEDGESVVIAGILQNCYDRPYKTKSRGKLGANLEIIDNTDMIRVTIWMDVWEQIAETILGNVGKIIIISGKTHYDTYRNCNVVHSVDKTKVEII